MKTPRQEFRVVALPAYMSLSLLVLALLFYSNRDFIERLMDVFDKICTEHIFRLRTS